MLSMSTCGLLEHSVITAFNEVVTSFAQCSMQLQVHRLPDRSLVLFLARCPAGKVEVVDSLTGLRHCTSSPCGHWTCRNGGTCVAQSQDKTICQCPEGYKGKWCEISQVKAGRPVGLSSGSILAISMCLLVFLGRKTSIHCCCFTIFFFNFYVLILYLALCWNQVCFTLML